MPSPQFAFDVAAPIRDGESLRVAVRKATIENATSADGLSGESNPATLGFELSIAGGALAIAGRTESRGSFAGLLPVARGYLRVNGLVETVEYERLDGASFTPLGRRESSARPGGTPLAALATPSGLSVVLKPTTGADTRLFVHVLEGAGQGKSTPAFEASSTVEPIGVFPCEDRYVALYEKVDGAARDLRLRELHADGAPFDPAVDVSLDSLQGKSVLSFVSVACDATRKSVMMLNTGRGVVEAHRDAAPGAAWKTEVRDAGAPRFAHAVHDGSAYLLTEGTETVAATFSAFGKASFSRRVVSSLRLAGLAGATAGCVATGRADRAGTGVDGSGDVMALALPIAPGEGVETISPDVIVLDRVGAQYTEQTRCSAGGGVPSSGGRGAWIGAGILLGVLVARKARRR